MTSYDKETSFKLEYIKRRVFSELGQYENEDGLVSKGSRKAVLESGVADAIYSAITEIYEKLGGKYGEAPFIDGGTDGDFEIRLNGIEAEALICLAASKLCSDRESSLYTRLLLKYSDLCESFFEVDVTQNRRNTFYSERERGIR